MNNEQPERPEGEGWRPVVTGDGEIRAWVRDAKPTKTATKINDRPEAVERTDGDLTYRVVDGLTTR